MTNIRLALPSEKMKLVDIWLRSVRATHHFLSEADIQALFPIVRDVALENLELWVLCDGRDVPVGFMGLADGALEALFLAPEYIGRGCGRKLVEHARKLKGPLRVDVNEQNPAAIEFYRKCGFVIAGRSETDSDGRPFPILHLREPA